MRPSGREMNQMRSVEFIPDYTKYAEGSVLVCFGETKVLCNASVTEGVPHFLRGTNQGWLTAEYSLLPRATHERASREAARGKQTGRTVEIQRLIGRSLRACLDFKALGDHTITVDCDVIQADGGTRTAAITGGCTALMLALRTLQRRGQLKKDPWRQQIAAVSVGVYKGEPVLDLDYAEDGHADTDMNVVMTEQGQFIELQGTAEGAPLARETLDQLLVLADQGIAELIQAQKALFEQI